MSRRRGTQEANAHSHSHGEPAHTHSHTADEGAGLGILNHGFDDVPRRASQAAHDAHKGHSYSHSHTHDDGADISPLSRTTGGHQDSSPESLGLSPTTPAVNGSLATPSSPFIPLYSPVAPRPASPTSSGQDDSANLSETYDALPPLSPLPSRGSAGSRLSAAEVKAQRHERIHSRNLSIFFPRPGQSVPDDAEGIAQEVEAPVMDANGWSGSIGQAPSGRELRNSSFKFGAQPLSVDVNVDSPTADGVSPALGGTKVTGRKGHHHKHSLSHQFFSFMDPAQTNPLLAGASQANDPFTDHDSHSHSHSQQSPSGLLSTQSVAQDLPTPSSQTSGSLASKLLALPLTSQAVAVFALFEFFLGASLWVDGQAGGSISVTGLGYLVVFDALGVMNLVAQQLLVGGGLSVSSLKSPFGNHRTETLLLFVQAIFLLFSSVYICKESIEHVLLLGHDHGQDFTEVVLPNVLLATAFVSALFSAIALGNHNKLTEAVGNRFLPARPLPSRRRRSSQVADLLSRSYGLFGNPFSLMVLACTGSLLFGGLIVPPGHLPSLDKAAAVLETVLTWSAAYPASVAFGQVLLQTAPPQRAVQIISLNKSLREVEAHPLFIYLKPPHVWRLVHHQASAVLPEARAPSVDYGKGRIRPASPSSSLKAANAAYAASSCLLVVTLVVHIREDASDRDVLEMTRFVYDKCASAVGAARYGRRAGSAHGGVSEVSGEGELTVEVRRGMPRWHESE